jgi:type I restriction enzyme S subunit
MTWDILAIGDFCLTGSGGTPSRKKASRYFGGNIPWVKSGELREGVITETEETITELAVIESSAKFIPKGALLVAMYGATIGRVAKLGIDATSNQAVCHILPDKSLADTQYMFHALQAQVPHWLVKGVGGAQPNISQEIIKNTVIPLPPLEEQRRIAAILDQSKVLSLKSRLSNELASSLIESEMIQRFGRPGSNQARSDCLSLVDAGVSVIDCPHSTPKWTEEGKVCLRTSNLGKGNWIWQDTRRISDHDFHERSRRAPLEPGDIVLSREGTVGIAAIVSYGMEVCMGQRLVQLKLDASCLLPEYLLAQLLCLLKPDRISHAMTGSTSKHINVKDLRELKIYCPPLQEQREFEAFCKSAKMLRAKIVALGEKSELLERSIQAASFKQ